MKTIKYILLTIFQLFFLSSAYSQELTVKSFKENTRDLSASTDVRTDNNNTPCALVKVQMATKDAQFEPSVVGTVQYKVNEYWVYMPAGTKHLKVKHPNFLTKDIVFADYGINALEKKTTYDLVIVLPQNTTTEQVVTEQYLVFQVKPENAMVEVNGEMWDVDRGQSMKYMPFGTYEWKVTAKNYHPMSGSITIDNPDNKHILNIDLKPAFGWIEVRGNEVKDATIYIDNELVGKAPFKSAAIASGTHTITIKRPMYKALTQEVIVNDGETTFVNPSLTADFCNVTLTVEGNAEIWINGEKKGISSWIGQLATGNYNFETRRTGHRNSQKTETITASSQPMTINLPSPTPIYGSLNVSTTPAMSQIIIDGKAVGETPMMIRQLLIGKHEVIVRKEGYGDFTSTVNIQEGQTSAIEGKLPDAIPSTPYKYVDLGLNVMWASCNIGAQKPDEFGDYFAWGEISSFFNGKKTFAWSNYKWNNGLGTTTENMTKYNGYGKGKDNKFKLELEDDPACALWGGIWRIPTLEDWRDLQENCIWTWTSINGTSGYEVKSKVNGNSIFLPAAGFRNDNLQYGKGKKIAYWSSNIDMGDATMAHCLGYDSKNVAEYVIQRYIGLSVRPVFSNNQKITGNKINNNSSTTISYTNNKEIQVNNSTANNSDNDKVFDVVEQMPSFPGGQTALKQYFQNNIMYSNIVSQNGNRSPAIVSVSFVVDKTGTICNVQVTKGVSPSFDKEAVRVVSNMPKWIPGKQNGQSVNVRYTVPVMFNL